MLLDEVYIVEGRHDTILYLTGLELEDTEAFEAGTSIQLFKLSKLDFHTRIYLIYCLSCQYNYIFLITVFVSNLLLK